MKTFHCDKCSNQIFFENTLCFNCKSTLGYQPATRSINAFEEAGDVEYHCSIHPYMSGTIHVG